jgi:4-hydroxy-2-oxoglutarate aldolase
MTSRCGGSIAKLVRLTTSLQSNPPTPARSTPFLFLDGLIADLTPWMQMGGHGTVSGIPNFAPRCGRRLFELLSKKIGLSGEEEKEMKRLQGVMSVADVEAVPAGVRGMSESQNEGSVYLADEWQSMRWGN